MGEYTRKESEIMESRTYYYARVSTAEQNLDRQIQAFRALGATDREIITDKERGKDLDRPGYAALKNTILHPGNTPVIKSLDRLSRSKADIMKGLRRFREQGIRVKILDLPTTMANRL
jgi:DNA invertase Pin-like site-specific DNA recombinase